MASDEKYLPRAREVHQAILDRFRDGFKIARNQDRGEVSMYVIAPDEIAKVLQSAAAEARREAKADALDAIAVRLRERFTRSSHQSPVEWYEVKDFAEELGCQARAIRALAAEEPGSGDDNSATRAKENG